jgi:hypothetical protein
MMPAKAIDEHFEHRAVAEVVELVAARLDGYSKRLGLFGPGGSRIWNVRQKSVENCVGRAAARRLSLRILAWRPGSRYFWSRLTVRLVLEAGAV